MIDIEDVKQEWKKIATGLIIIVAISLAAYFYSIYAQMNDHLSMNMDTNASEIIHNEYDGMPEEFQGLRKK